MLRHAEGVINKQCGYRHTEGDVVLEAILEVSDGLEMHVRKDVCDRAVVGRVDTVHLLQRVRRNGVCVGQGHPVVNQRSALARTYVFPKQLCHKWAVDAVSGALEDYETSFDTMLLLLHKAS